MATTTEKQRDVFTAPPEAAALPIWAQFMKGALAGHADESFDAPEGIAYAAIDPVTGQLAGPACPRLFSEAFIAGTEPTKTC